MARSLVPAALAVKPARRTRTALTQAAAPANRWGQFPLLAVITAVGLLVIALANAFSRQGVPNADRLFWLGLVIIVAPVTYRLLAVRAARVERLALAVLFGLSLYLIKVMQSPFALTYSDEFVHLFNANRIFDTGRLFSENTILPATPFYPGLEAAAAALMHLADLDGFGAGLVVVGLARLVMTVGLFLLFEEISQSTRTASLATVLYAANANFIFWSAQFSYESLALPLAVLTLWVVARREARKQPAEYRGLTAAALLLTGMIVVTHHLTSYFLVASLGAWTLLASPARPWLVRASGAALARIDATRGGRRLMSAARALTGEPAPAPSRPTPSRGLALLTLIALVATAFWLFYAASLTLAYLTPVLREALNSLIGTMAGESTGRELFQSTGDAVATPVWERVTGISAVLLCLAGLPFGLRQIWRRHLHQPLALLHTAAALAYFALLGLRFVPKAWEISNRSSEFLFIGLALVLAGGRAPHWLPRRARPGLRLGLTTAATVIIFGGVIAGWPPLLRTAQPNVVAVGDRLLRPAGWAAADWMHSFLGPNYHVAAQEAPGRYIFASGDQLAYVTPVYGIKSIYTAHFLQDWQFETLAAAEIDFLVMDRRRISTNGMLGYFFDRGAGYQLPEDELLSPEIYAKFDDLPQVGRILDAGNLVIYDLRALDHAAR